MVVVFGWSVLSLVFLDEVLALAAFGVWGWQASPRWLLVWLPPLLAVAAWSLLASPRARFGGRVARPATKVVVLGLASVALWDAGHPGWATALLVLSVLVNALAQLAGVRALVAEG